MAIRLTFEQAAARGVLDKTVKEHRAVWAEIITSTMRIGAQVLQRDERRLVRSAGLGRGVEKGWRIKVFPDEPGKKSVSASSIVKSNAPRIIRGFEAGGTTRPVFARGLAIPLDKSLKGSEERLEGLKRGLRPTPDNLRARFGPFRLIPLSKDKAFLVAARLRTSTSRKTGKVSLRRANEKTRKGQVTGVMFLLLRRRTLRKRLSRRGIRFKAERRIVRILESVDDG